LGIEQLLTALLEEVRRRVRNGQLTERGLARLTGTSQPHLHHILKGKRGITPKLADRMMDVLALDLSALIELGHTDLQASLSQPGAIPSPASPRTSSDPPSRSFAPGPPIHEPPVLVPILDGLIGPGHPRPLPFRQPRYLPVPRRELPPDVALLAARMAFDPQASPAFVSDDLIVIAAAPLPAVFTAEMPGLSWVLDHLGSWRVEPPPHPGWHSAPDTAPYIPAPYIPAPDIPALRTPGAEQLDLDLFDPTDARPLDAGSPGVSVVGVVVLCIRRMGPLRLPLFDPESPGR
jgi:plasmid maintenance system antidote protein VapI